MADLMVQERLAVLCYRWGLGQLLNFIIRNVWILRLLCPELTSLP